jgi:hypothetical protein
VHDVGSETGDAVSTVEGSAVGGAALGIATCLVGVAVDNNVVLGTVEDYAIGAAVVKGRRALRSV